MKDSFRWFYDLRYKCMVGFQVRNFSNSKNFGLSIYKLIKELMIYLQWKIGVDLMDLFYTN